MESQITFNYCQEVCVRDQWILKNKNMRWIYEAFNIWLYLNEVLVFDEYLRPGHF